MPLPLVFIGIAAATGATGIGSSVKAGVDQMHAKKLNLNSEERIEKAASRLDVLRKQCGESLESLGAEKFAVLGGSLKDFVDTFSQLKNVDLSDSVGIQELEKFHIDKQASVEIGELGNFVATLTTGIATGVTGGALAAFGAYSAAATFATASTGTAIGTLSGAAATNATLAFFGGGSLASGGLGMAGGTMVLGGLVAGPALLVMGLIASNKAGKSLENALASAEEADVVCNQLENASFQCMSIRRRTYMFYSLLARLDSFLLPLVFDMKDIIKKEGVDYSQYSAESKKIVARAASVAVTIKNVIDTPILSENGELVEESADSYNKFLPSVDKE